MINLSSFIFESREVSTTSNKQRKKELEKWLKHKKYKDYVDTLNKMINDPKAKTLLEDGFGGELGDTKLTFNVKEIPVSQLMPTQSEIDLNKSIKHALVNKDSLCKTFSDPIEINKPIITFRENYIIDGHHTWLQAIILNPNGKILSFNYDGDISPIQMLKAVQGSIAAVKAEDNKNDGKLPSEKVSGPNIFDDKFDENKIKKYIEDIIDWKEIYESFIEFIPQFKSKKLTKQIKEDIVSWLIDRFLDIKANNYPESFAQKRENMPQVYKGGTDQNDKNTAMPDKKGSALNKLKDDKFIKSAIK